MELGIYESLITEQLKKRLSELDGNRYFIADDKNLDAAEAVFYLSAHLNKAIANALKVIKVDKKDLLVAKQIEITNNLLRYLSEQISQYNFNEDLLDAEGHILQGVLDQLHVEYTDIRLYLKEITPLSRLTQSELFTGGNVGLSLDGELKKEIRSADRVDLLVSFIKWKAIVILKDALEEFTNRGGTLRVITTTYMGATDAKAIDELSKLKNTQIKVSYNTSNERLHAKAYLFYRNTGFHTGYIGSSNFSRSALTDGLEWNVKVTTSEIPHIIDKFQKTFESYWNNAEFERYEEGKYEQLHNALNRNKFDRNTSEVIQFFDVKPYHYQAEILEKLKVERDVHGSQRNLVVAATGTGKTMISAFDFKKYIKQNPDARLLFVAHRIEILQQSLKTFRNVLREHNFGELYGGGHEPTNKRNIFATIQTLSRIDFSAFCAPEYYDYIVFDEVHHAKADTYQLVMQYFTPKIFLGLTATPERMDGKSILPDFNYRIAAEIRLPDALNNKLLCPFQYFGISDTIDYAKIAWRNGKYDSSELTNVYTSNDLRVGNILHNLVKYSKDYQNVCAVGFCISQDHAKFMSRKFQDVGLSADYLVSENSHKRQDILEAFRKRKINYLFVVDIVNEGVDIPEIDTVLFLRPTESLTVFLQQLGRGLRLHDDKDVLTVLDFVGHARDEYDFENKFRALIGKTNTTVQSEIEKDFPHLPLGSSIVLEKKAKEYILENIRKATQLNKRHLIARIQSYQNHTTAPLTLKSFLNIYNLELKHIYKNHLFSSLCAEAHGHPIDGTNIERYKAMLSKKWMVTESLSYFRFILNLMERSFNLNQLEQTEENRLMALMLHYDFYMGATSIVSLEESIKDIGRNKVLVDEMKAFLEVKIDHIGFEELPCTDLGYSFPLRIHARYTREQILVALRLSTLQQQSSNREGVALNKELNTEALFINLKKSEEDFSPTTMYNDYAISEDLFHWESQNETSPTSGKGLSYINQADTSKRILVFVRESVKNADGFTEGYVFIGPAHFVRYEGAKPMAITWRLEEPIPEYLWTASAKMVVG